MRVYIEPKRLVITYMKNKASHNRRIFKNSIMLFFRMLLVTCVTLYTSRVVLHNLGVDDYGIYNVVGGLVTMFAVISGSLSGAVGRFLTFELGKGNDNKLKEVFCTSVTVQFILSIIIIILIETVAVWFLNNKMQIPKERLFASNCVLQFSLIAFVINLLSVPYNAAIIAHEKMSFFAFISLFESIGKLLIAYMISTSSWDKLIYYSMLSVILALIVRFIYVWFCRNSFSECTYKISFNANTFKEMFVFSGWNFIGVSSRILRENGGSILINMFAGPVVNAANGIAIQVTNAANQFVGSFTTAINPQITKTYAKGDLDSHFDLIVKGAKFTFLLMFLVSLPLMLNTEFVLQLWLKEVPNHTVLFVRLSLTYSLFESLSAPLVTSMLATGKIKNYQIIVGSVQLLNLPISYFLLLSGFIPEVVFIVAIALSLVSLLLRLYLLHRMIKFKMSNFVYKVILRIVCIVAFSVPSSIAISNYIDFNFNGFIISSSMCVLLSTLCIYFIGCDAEERAFLNAKANQLRQKVF